jgi:putative hemolysin
VSGIGTELLVLFALVLVNGLFAGAEIAIVSLRPSRLKELIESGSEGARAAQRLRSHPERFLATVQVGISLVSASAGAFGGARFSAALQPLVARIASLEEYAHEISFVIAVALISYLSLILGELVPKSLALRSNETYGLLVARPLEWLAWLARPLVWFLMASSNTVLKLFGDHTDFLEGRLSSDELRHLVDQASEGGELAPEAGEIAARALLFAELSAADVMVHRRYVVGLPINAGEADIRSALLDDGHRRVPVFEGSIDNTLGYVTWRDVVEKVWEKQPIVLRELMRPGYFVPETTPAIDLLREMQRRRVQLAIAVDEHGGTAGIVTLEDLLEELVGEIVSEHDGDQAHPVRREADGTALVQGTVAIREVNRELELRLDEPPDTSTIGGLAVLLAGGRFPRVGEVLTAADGTQLEVLEASVRRVRLVRLRPAPPHEDDSAES